MNALLPRHEGATLYGANLHALLLGHVLLQGGYFACIATIAVSGSTIAARACIKTRGLLCMHCHQCSSIAARACIATRALLPGEMPVPCIAQGKAMKSCMATV